MSLLSVPFKSLQVYALINPRKQLFVLNRGKGYYLPSGDNQMHPHDEYLRRHYGQFFKDNQLSLEGHFDLIGTPIEDLMIDDGRRRCSFFSAKIKGELLTEEGSARFVSIEHTPPHSFQEGFRNLVELPDLQNRLR